jgi:hypothetical protein
MGLVFSPVQRTTGGATPGNNVIGGSEPHSEKTTYQDLTKDYCYSFSEIARLCLLEGEFDERIRFQCVHYTSAGTHALRLGRQKQKAI